jgi:hypothetical protein
MSDRHRGEVVYEIEMGRFWRIAPWSERKAERAGNHLAFPGDSLCMIAPLCRPDLPATSCPHTGSRPARRHTWLFALLAGASHWSTALVEFAGFAIIVTSLPDIARRWRAPLGEAGAVVRGRWFVRGAIALWGVYIISVCMSLAVSGTLLTAHAGLLLHAMLFPAVLVAPVEAKDVKTIGVVYIASGVISILATLLLNLSAGYVSPAMVFTGLTTFADLTVLIVIVLIAGLPPRRQWDLLASLALIAGGLAVAAVFWTAERAPVAVLAAAGAGFFALTRPRLLTLWGILTLSCFFLAPPALRARADWVARGNVIDRYVVWEEGIRLLSEVPPFGFGPDSFPRLLSDDARGRFTNRPPASWHNDMLQTALDSGPIAATAAGGLIALTMIGAMCHSWEMRRCGTGSASAIPGLLLLCLTVLGLVGSVMTTAILGSVFWSLMGLTVRGYSLGPPVRKVEEVRTNQPSSEGEW